MDGSASASGSGRAAAPTPVLDRFRAMLRDREEKMRLAGAVAADGHVPPPSAAEVVRMYAELLGSLSVNSKPVITELTIIADENRHAAAGIVEAICDRIRHAPEDKKLPSLYLLDSIVKNIRHEYVRYFANRLPEVFCEAYNQVHPSLYPAMQHLFGTWSIVFPTSVLRQIEKELHFSTSGSQQPPSSASVGRSESSSPRPSHGIHINPKYLEARRQLGNSVADIQHARGVPSSLQLYGQKSPVNYNEYEVNRRDIFPSQLELATGGSPRLAAGQMSSVVKGEDQFLHPKGKVLRSLSPLRTGLRRSASPSGDMFRRHLSPASVVERPSPSLSENELRSSKVGNRNRWLERSGPSVDGFQQRENSTMYDRNKQRTRELIDAYGSYNKDVSYYESLPKTQKFDVDGTKSEAAARKWKISEEDEYAWEDMSPTLADRSRGNNSPFTYDAARLSTTVGVSRPNTGILESDLMRYSRPTHVQMHPVDDPALSVEERTRLLPSDHESLNKKYLDDTGYQTPSLPPYRASHYAQDHWKLPHVAPPSSYPCLNPESRGRVHQMPFMENKIKPSFGLQFDNASDGELPYSRLPSACSESINVATETVVKRLAQRTESPPGQPVVWPPVQRSLPLPPNPIYSHLKQLHNPLEFADVNKSTVYHGANSSSYVSQKQFDFIDGRPSSLNKMHHSPDHQSGLIHLNQQSREHGDIMGIRSQEVHGNLVSCAPAQVSSHVAPAQLLNPIQAQVQGPVPVPVLPNPSTDVLRQTHRGSLPPLPPGPPPAASQVGPSSESKSVITSATPASAFSGLISSLMEKGLISLTAPAPPQDSLGVEFNSDLLKVRHESAVNGLYGDLPRKCTTCGLRFRLQEEHSNHMDWHVTKNRISKNRKQKPSRKWFVNAKEWLSGAETLGTDFVPGFIPTEEVTEKKEGKELAVPADENQNVCALCGEPFEDFYSDETEEWMYKGAVYLNAPDGSIEGLGRFQLGPIVHAVCRSESNKVLGEG